MNEIILKNGWKLIDLSALVNIFDRKRVPLNSREREKIKGDIPYLGANGIVDYIDKYIFDGEYLLIAEDGGRFKKFEHSCYIFSGRFWVNNHAHIVQAKPDKALNRWLYYYLIYENLEKYCSGATRLKLNQEKLKSILIPIPYNKGSVDIKEQRRIVSKIESLFAEIDNGIKKAKQALHDSKKVLQSELNKIFNKRLKMDWKKIKLGEYSSFKGGKQPPKSAFKNKPEKGYVRLLQIRDFSKREEPVYVDQKNNLTYVEEDDVLIARYGASVGKILTGKKGAINVAIIKTEPRKGLAKRYLYYFLNNPDFQRYITNIPGRMAQAGFDKNVLNVVEVPVPLLNNKIDDREQQNIVSRLDSISEQIRALENTYHKQIGDFKKLKQSILNRAFKGAL